MFRMLESVPLRRVKILAVLAAIVFAAGVAGQPVLASTGADATILNVATVTYKDASGTASFSATASVTVTVSLVEAPLTLSGRPTGANPGDTAALPTAASTASGTTQSYLYAMTATANGDDTYDLSISKDSTANVSGDTVTSALVGPDGTTVLTASPTSADLGASVIVGVPTASSLEFPAGSLGALAINDILVVDGVDYLVTAVSNGTSSSHTNGSGPNSSAGATTSETVASVTVAENTDGSNTTPAFPTGGGSALIGLIAAEQVLLRVSVTAVASVPGSDGTVDFDVVAEPDGTPGSNTAQVQDVTTTFTAVDLAIQKEVRNVTQSGSFGASASGDPGDVLEYRVTVSNSGGDATDVSVSDPVPSYTALIVYSDTYAGTVGAFGAAAFFAQADPAGTAVDLTVDSADNEDSTIASGDAAAAGAGSSLTFHIGTGNTSSLGGTLTSSDTIVILYRVQIQ